MKVSDELIQDWTEGEAMLRKFGHEYGLAIIQKAFMEIDEAIMGPEPSVEERF